MNKLALSIVAASIFLGASPFIADEFLLDEETQFQQNMSAIVVSGEVSENGTRVGVNPGQNLDFGEIETGIKVTKFLEFESDRTQLVRLDVEGNISEKINTTESQMVEGDTRLGLSFRSNETGYFTGETVLKTFAPNGGLGEAWLDLKTRF
jgi:hypothetical protein